MSADEHIRAMREALVAEHESRIAEVQRWADEASDDWHRRWHLDHVARLRAMRYPWQADREAEAAA
ncbi:MAG TPA: hypothetical protein VFX60_08315 [Micromonospora sp.]|nr:hypothetical protein [Micromonospora sp.]